MDLSLGFTKSEASNLSSCPGKRHHATYPPHNSTQNHNTEMKTRIFFATFVAFLCTTLFTSDTLATERKKRLTYRERKEAEKQAVIDAERERRREVRNRLNPTDDDALEILKQTDLEFQAKVKEVTDANAGQSDSVKSSALLAAFQELEGNDWFPLRFKTGDTSEPISNIHPDYPAKPDEGKPAMLRVLLQRVRSNNEVKYFVAYLPSTTDFAKIRFFHVLPNLGGVYVLTVGELDFVQDLCYQHAKFPGGSSYYGKTWTPTVDKFQEYHSKVVKTPIASVQPVQSNVTITFTPTPIPPAPLRIKPQTP